MPGASLSSSLGMGIQLTPPDTWFRVWQWKTAVQLKSHCRRPMVTFLLHLGPLRLSSPGREELKEPHSRPQLVLTHHCCSPFSWCLSAGLLIVYPASWIFQDSKFSPDQSEIPSASSSQLKRKKASKGKMKCPGKGQALVYDDGAITVSS